MNNNNQVVKIKKYFFIENPQKNFEKKFHKIIPKNTRNANHFLRTNFVEKFQKILEKKILLFFVENPEEKLYNFSESFLETFLRKLYNFFRAFFGRKIFRKSAQKNRIKN